MSDKYWIGYLAAKPAISYETFLEYKLAKRDKRIATLERENRNAHRIAGCTQDNCKSNGFECVGGGE